MSATRKATLSDVAAMLPLLYAFHRESSFRDVPVETKKFEAFLRARIQDAKHACILYESKAGSLDGILIGYITPYYFSAELGAWDLVVYVRPERRGSLVGYRLWSAFKAWAQEAGARFMWLGSAANIEPARIRRFYTGLGMQEVGALYRLELREAPARAQ